MVKQRKILKPFTKKLILFSCGMVCIILFFILPPNREWFQSRILVYLDDFTKERHNFNEEHRMQYRFANDYTFSKQIEHLLQQKGAAKSALVLLPPSDYFKHCNINYDVPEPVVFYYFTGIKTVWANCSNAQEANWYVRVNNGKILLDTVTNKQALMDTIAAFKKYKISL